MRSAILAIIFNVIAAYTASGAAFRTRPIGVQDLIHLVVVIDEPDRMTEEDYAAKHKTTPEAVQRRFAATGTFRCPKFQGQAQLTVRNDIITTAGHSLYAELNCKKRAQIEKCVFETYLSGTKKVAKISAVIDTGVKCPGGPYDPRYDWAILQLNKPLSDVEPYSVDRVMSDSIEKNQVVTAVGKSLDFNPNWVTNLSANIDILPKHIGECSIRSLYAAYLETFSYLGTDCDGSFGMSGGSLLNTSKAIPILLGIFSTGTATKESEVKAAIYSTPKFVKYDQQYFFAGVVPVRGKLLERLLALQGQASESQKNGVVDRNNRPLTSGK
jgi:hypothetical protein